ncbi:MAG: gfo/Idh/MocA family oxidoreductase, partial [Nitrospira sp.]
AMRVEHLQGSDEEPLKLELDAFLQAVRSGAPPVVSGEDGTATMALAQRILDVIDAFWRRHASV